jgi:hypothetical protein
VTGILLFQGKVNGGITVMDSKVDLHLIYT